MKRTRKWAYVEQEAQRLKGLRLSAKEIADRLGVTKSTVNRWIAAGKFRDEPPAVRVERAVVLASIHGKTPAEWTKAVREDYDLDATDEQIVGMAEACLLITRDPNAAPALRLQAMREFRGSVKQLNLVARAADEKAADDPPKRKTFEPPRRTGTDPRGILTGVK